MNVINTIPTPRFRDASRRVASYAYGALSPVKFNASVINGPYADRRMYKGGERETERQTERKRKGVCVCVCGAWNSHETFQRVIAREEDRY